MDSVSESSTKKKILLELKKNGSLSVDSLSRKVNITPMGVRQHLLILERSGIVEYTTVKHGVGRPGFLYGLTDKADDLFPKGYQEFLMDLLSDIEKRDGRQGIDGIFRRRKDRFVAGYVNLLSGITDRNDRARAFSKALEDDGYFTELDDKGDHLQLTQFNCPISRVARKYREACHYDLMMIQEFFGAGVDRRQCFSDGDQACIYDIPKSG